MSQEPCRFEVTREFDEHHDGEWSCAAFSEADVSQAVGAFAALGLQAIHSGSRRHLVELEVCAVLKKGGARDQRDEHDQDLMNALLIYRQTITRFKIIGQIETAKQHSSQAETE